MLALLPKLLAIASIPAIVTALWYRRAGPSWTCILAAVSAATIFAILRTPIRDPYVHNLFGIDNFTLRLKLGPHTFIYALILAAVAIAIQRQAMKLAKAKITKWQDAVLFGLAYSTTNAVLQAVIWLEYGITRTAYTYDQLPYIRSLPLPPVLAIFKQLPFDVVVMHTTILLGDQDIFYLATEQGIAPTIFNVGIAAAVFYSIQTQKKWPLAAATALHIVPIIIPVVLPRQRVSNYFVTLFVQSDTGLSILMRLGNEGIETLFPYFGLLPAILTALPALALAIYIRKATTNSSPIDSVPNNG